MASLKIVFRKIVDKLFFPTHCKLDNLTALMNDQFYQIQINNGFSRAVANINLRNTDRSNPVTWEFSGFSQNGEDGIIDYLITQLKRKNRYFIEIGAANGIANNTAWLAHAKKYAGLMIDGNELSIEIAKRNSPIGIEAYSMFVDKNNIDEIKKLAVYNNPDVFSLDIDGNDYYIAKAIIASGFRPKIFVVEYNSAFGPEDSKTIVYAPDFNIAKAHQSQLYYGVSITGWRNFFESHGYKLVTVDSNGVNAIFMDPNEFEISFVNQIKGLLFAENFYQMRKFKSTWKGQFQFIKDMEYFEIRPLA